MPRYNFHMGVTLRCYGNVEVEAESVEAALPLLTADFIGENIDITETTTDSGQDLAILDVSDIDSGDDAEDWDGYPLPSPYDPPVVPKAIADFLRQMAQFTTPEDEFEERKGEDGKVHDDGVTYEDADELLAEISDDRLMDEYAAFCWMIREARKLRKQVEGRANG